MGAGQSKLGCLSPDTQSDDEGRNIIKGEVLNHETFAPKKARSILGIENNEGDDNTPVRLKSSGGLDFRDDPDMEEDGQKNLEQDIKPSKENSVFGQPRNAGTADMKEKADELIRHLEKKDEGNDSDMIQDHMDEIDETKQDLNHESEKKLPFSFGKAKTEEKPNEDIEQNGNVEENQKMSDKVQNFFKRVFPKENTAVTYEGDMEENDEMPQKEEDKIDKKHANISEAEKQSKESDGSKVTDFFKGIIPEGLRGQNNKDEQDEQISEPKKEDDAKPETLADDKSKFSNFFKNILPNKQKDKNGEGKLGDEIDKEEQHGGGPVDNTNAGDTEENAGFPQKGDLDNKKDADVTETESKESDGSKVKAFFKGIFQDRGKEKAHKDDADGENKPVTEEKDSDKSTFPDFFKEAFTRKSKSEDDNNEGLKDKENDDTKEEENAGDKDTENKSIIGEKNTSKLKFPELLKGAFPQETSENNYEGEGEENDEMPQKDDTADKEKANITEGETKLKESDDSKVTGFLKGILPKGPKENDEKANETDEAEKHDSDLQNGNNEESKEKPRLPGFLTGLLSKRSKSNEKEQTDEVEGKVKETGELPIEEGKAEKENAILSEAEKQSNEIDDSKVEQVNGQNKDLKSGEESDKSKVSDFFKEIFSSRSKSKEKHEDDESVLTKEPTNENNTKSEEKAEDIPKIFGIFKGKFKGEDDKTKQDQGDEKDADIEHTDETESGKDKDSSKFKLPSFLTRAFPKETTENNYEGKVEENDEMPLKDEKDDDDKMNKEQDEPKPHENGLKADETALEEQHDLNEGGGDQSKEITDGKSKVKEFFQGILPNKSKSEEKGESKENELDKNEAEAKETTDDKSKFPKVFKGMFSNKEKKDESKDTDDQAVNENKIKADDAEGTESSKDSTSSKLKLPSVFEKVFPKETTENTYEGDAEENDEMPKNEKEAETNKESEGKHDQEKEEDNESHQNKEVGSGDKTDNRSRLQDFFKGIRPKRSKSEEKDKENEQGGEFDEATKPENESKFSNFFKKLSPKTSNEQEKENKGNDENGTETGTFEANEGGAETIDENLQRDEGQTNPEKTEGTEEQKESHGSKVKAFFKGIFSTSAKEKDHKDHPEKEDKTVTEENNGEKSIFPDFFKGTSTRKSKDGDDNEEHTPEVKDIDEQQSPDITDGKSEKEESKFSSLFKGLRPKGSKEKETEKKDEENVEDEIKSEKDSDTKDKSSKLKIPEFLKGAFPKETSQRNYEGEGEENDEMPQKDEDKSKKHEHDIEAGVEQTEKRDESKDRDIGNDIEKEYDGDTESDDKFKTPQVLQKMLPKKSPDNVQLDDEPNGEAESVDKDKEKSKVKGFFEGLRPKGSKEKKDTRETDSDVLKLGDEPTTQPEKTEEKSDTNISDKIQEFFKGIAPKKKKDSKEDVTPDEDVETLKLKAGDKVEDEVPEGDLKPQEKDVENKEETISDKMQNFFKRLRPQSSKDRDANEEKENEDGAAWQAYEDAQKEENQSVKPETGRPDVKEKLQNLFEGMRPKDGKPENSVQDTEKAQEVTADQMVEKPVNQSDSKAKVKESKIPVLYGKKESKDAKNAEPNNKNKDASETGKYPEADAKSEENKATGNRSGMVQDKETNDRDSRIPVLYGKKDKKDNAKEKSSKPAEVNEQKDKDAFEEFRKSLQDQAQVHKLIADSLAETPHDEVEKSSEKESTGIYDEIPVKEMKDILDTDKDKNRANNFSVTVIKGGEPEDKPKATMLALGAHANLVGSVIDSEDLAKGNEKQSNEEDKNQPVFADEKESVNEAVPEEVSNNENKIPQVNDTQTPTSNIEDSQPSVKESVPPPSRIPRLSTSKDKPSKVQTGDESDGKADAEDIMKPSHATTVESSGFDDDDQHSTPSDDTVIENEVSPDEEQCGKKSTNELNMENDTPKEGNSLVTEPGDRQDEGKSVFTGKDPEEKELIDDAAKDRADQHQDQEIADNNEVKGQNDKFLPGHIAENNQLHDKNELNKGDETNAQIESLPDNKEESHIELSDDEIHNLAVKEQDTKRVPVVHTEPEDEKPDDSEMWSGVLNNKLMSTGDIEHSAIIDVDDPVNFKAATFQPSIRGVRGIIEALDGDTEAIDEDGVLLGSTEYPEPFKPKKVYEGKQIFAVTADGDRDCTVYKTKRHIIISTYKEEAHLKAMQRVQAVARYIEKNLEN